MGCSYTVYCAYFNSDWITQSLKISLTFNTSTCMIYLADWPNCFMKPETTNSLNLKGLYSTFDVHFASFDSELTDTTSSWTTSKDTDKCLNRHGCWLPLNPSRLHCFIELRLSKHVDTCANMSDRCPLIHLHVLFNLLAVVNKFYLR